LSGWLNSSSNATASPLFLESREICPRLIRQG
jgi:hypothetical protein